MAKRDTLSIALLSLGISFAGSQAWAQGKKGKKNKKNPEAAAKEEAEPDDSESVEPAPVETDLEPAERPLAGYDRGFYLSDGGVNTLVVGGRVQGRFELVSLDRGEADRLNTHAFSVERARVQLSGQTLTKRLAYKFQADFGQGQVALKDYYLDYHAGDGALRIRGGQFKKPFGRQQITSSGSLQFVDRSIVDAHFDNGRDIGLMLHNDFESSPETEWALGVFNGTGDQGAFVPVIDPATMEVVGGEFTNVPLKVRPAVVGRVGYNSADIDGYTEADLEGGDLRFAIAATVMTHFQIGAGQASTRLGGDFAVKQSGVSATGGIYADMQGPTVDDLSYAGIGAYTQVGYMVDAIYEPAVRYAVIAEEGGNNRQEASAAFSIYDFGHDFKWQTDVSLLATDDGLAKRKDLRARSQVQLVF